MVHSNSISPFALEALELDIHPVHEMQLMQLRRTTLLRGGGLLRERVKAFRWFSN